MKFEQTVLENGLTIIGETNPNVHSVAFGFFVKTGSRDETPDVAGVSHFLEHMVFKGTDKYSPEAVNRIFDEIGAKYNASTGEEVTQFYAAVLPEYLPTAFELYANILFPSLREDDFEMEKKVILEEIGMYDDMPAFSAYEKLMELHFASHPLGQSILGSNESITALTCQQMRNYHHQQYLAGNITLAVAGNVEWSTVLELAQLNCSHWPAGKTDRDVAEAQPVGGSRIMQKESILQEHIAQMAPAPPAHSPLRFAAEILSVVVGDDANSRLYWELIEPGFAESAEMSYNEYDGSGVYMTFLSCNPEQAEQHLQKISQIYAEVNQSGITEQELEQAKNKVASRLVMRSERPMGRLSTLGSNWLYRQEYRSVAADMETLFSLTTADVQNLLEIYPLKQLTTVAIGPLASFQ